MIGNILLTALLLWFACVALEWFTLGNFRQALEDGTMDWLMICIGALFVGGVIWIWG